MLKKLLSDGTPGGSEQKQQQSQAKVAEMMKLDAVVNQYSKKVGIEKTNLLYMLLGQKSPLTTTETNSMIAHKGETPVNTGKAAQVAYNNLVGGGGGEPPIPEGPVMQLRASQQQRNHKSQH